MLYAQTKDGELWPGTTVKCTIQDCPVQVVVPKDISPRQFCESFGWVFVENLRSDLIVAGQKTSGMICHLHVIHPKLENENIHNICDILTIHDPHRHVDGWYCTGGNVI